MSHNGKTTNSSGWNAVFSWIKYALTGKRDETKAVSQSSVSASSLVDLDARVKSIEQAILSLRDGSDAPSVYKMVQSPKSSPSASSTAIAFIDTVTQDENGEITATKKTVRSGTTSQSGVVQLEDSHASTSTTKAATPKNVKEAYDLANGKYAKPSGGIPKTDLASGVQSSLDKADSALQSHQSVTNSNPTLSWGNTSTVGKVGDTNLQVTMPSNPASGKSDSSHTHSVQINGDTKTIAATGGAAVDLGTYKVFNYSQVYAVADYSSSTRYILLAHRPCEYTSNWEESSLFKLVVHDGNYPKELIFRLFAHGSGFDGTPEIPADLRVYRVCSNGFTDEQLNMLDVRMFFNERTTGKIKFNFGIFIDRNYLQGKWVSYQLYPLSVEVNDQGRYIDNGLSCWTYKDGVNLYETSNIHDYLYSYAFRYYDLNLIRANVSHADKVDGYHVVVGSVGSDPNTIYVY